jgi:muramoyltetrapeptide carboxypeptidase LdcA involved in peptidoglycan recycling
VDDARNYKSHREEKPFETLGTGFFLEKRMGGNINFHMTSIDYYFFPKTKSMRILGLEDASSARAFTTLLATSSSCIFFVSEYNGHLATAGITGAG